MGRDSVKELHVWPPNLKVVPIDENIYPRNTEYITHYSGSHFLFHYPHITPRLPTLVWVLGDVGTVDGGNLASPSITSPPRSTAFWNSKVAQGFLLNPKPRGRRKPLAGMLDYNSNCMVFLDLTFICHFLALI